MEFFPLVSIPILYVFLAILKPYLQPRLPFNLCAVCVAVSLTWLILATMYLFGSTVPPLTIGILMGMSVTGLMYKSEAYFKTQKLKHFWLVRLLIIIGGFYSVYSFLEEKWNILILILTVSILSLAIVTFLFQAPEKADTQNSLLKKLEDCC